MLACVLGAVLVVVGCGGGMSSKPQRPVAESTGRGMLDTRASDFKPTRGCSLVGGIGGTRGDLVAPPIPKVSAAIVGRTITVRWSFLTMPAACRPNGVRVSANSVGKEDNIALGPAHEGYVAIDGPSGSVKLDAPILDLPPYEASVSSIGRDDYESPTTTVPVIGSAPGCTARLPLAHCVAVAKSFFQRCVKGTAPRSACDPRFWRSQPLLPVKPLQGVTSRSLATSLRGLDARAESPSLTLIGVSCARLPHCEVTWETPGQPASRFTYDYLMSGIVYKGSTGCWVAARRRIVGQPADQSAVREVGGGTPGGCTSQHY
jgi:hypothetical protein